MRRVLFLVAIALFTLMLSTSYAQQINVCTNMEYNKILGAFGQPMSNLTGGQFTFSEEKEGVRYYTLTCPKGHFHETPTGQETPKDTVISWGFVVNQNGQELSYARIISFKVHEIAPTFDIMSRNIGFEPKITSEDGKTIHTWHTPERITIKVKVDETPDLQDHNVWRKFKIIHYFDCLRPANSQ